VRLRRAGIDNPRLEARLLLAHAHGVTAEALLRDPAAAANMASLSPLVTRREAHEPLALIVGHREFWSLRFAVSPATLIPRPESETLIDAAVAAFAYREPPRLVLDLGTGTGCLLLAALSEFPAAVGIGVDRSVEAAALAARNAAALHLADRALFVCGDWADALSTRFDLVLGNPPYIPTEDLGILMPDVARYEPRAALDGGPNGLAAHRRLIPVLPRLMTPTGVAVLEIGAGQAETAVELARQAGFATELRPDLGGMPRALVLRSARP
jgi:release factor glutamine methyltransferase